jgi:hypothetical protein
MYVVEPGQGGGTGLSPSGDVPPMPPPPLSLSMRGCVGCLLAPTRLPGVTSRRRRLRIPNAHQLRRLADAPVVDEDGGEETRGSCCTGLHDAGAGAATRAGRAIILEMGGTDGSIASIDGFD